AATPSTPPSSATVAMAEAVEDHEKVTLPTGSPPESIAVATSWTDSPTSIVWRSGATVIDVISVNAVASLESQAAAAMTMQNVAARRRTSRDDFSSYISDHLAVSGRAGRPACPVRRGRPPASA